MSKPNEKRFKAETLYKKGLSYKEISEKLDTPESTIRRWKSTYKWENPNDPNTRTQSAEQKTKKKRGGQKGNVNAVGNNGGAPSGNTNALKHGGYSKILQSNLSEEEKALFKSVPTDSEKILTDELALLTVREHRLLKAIKKYTDMPGGQAVQYITSIEDKKIFDNSAEGEDEKKRYQEIRQEKQDEGLVTYFGKNLNVTTQTEATYNIVLRLERELTSVQRQKERTIMLLHRMGYDAKMLEIKMKQIGEGETEIEDTDDIDGEIYGEDIQEEKNNSV